MRGRRGQADAERELLGPLEVRHAREQLSLRQRQLLELSSTMEALAPQDTLRKAQAADAMREAADLAQFQADMEAQRCGARVWGVRVSGAPGGAWCVGLFVTIGTCAP
jgi:hypothetical protein